jgi:riboflavin biosynthesis pyrimidine reductase
LAKTPLKSISQIPIVFRTPDIRSVVITTNTGADHMRRDFNGFESYQPQVFTTGKQLDMRRAMQHLRQQYGVKLLVIEGGPRLCGSLAKSRLYDEWFLTTAPQIVGNAVAGVRPTFIQGVEFAPETALWHRLISVKVAGDLVFERYRKTES